MELRERLKKMDAELVEAEQSLEDDLCLNKSKVSLQTN
jgi:hypothetical protein